MSMLPVLLVGCALHVGTPPAPGWRVVSVDAPVAEPDVDLALRGAIETALAARGASGAHGLHLTVERADWSPAQRDGNVLIYQARLLARVSAGGRGRTVDVRADVLAPVTAAQARVLRAEAFAALADRAAAEVVTWLLLAGPSLPAG